MGIGIRLQGHHRSASAEAFLEDLEGALLSQAGDPTPRVERGEVEAGEGLLLAELHPGAEPLQVRTRGDAVELVANTGTAGPGYHRHVVALTNAMEVEWTSREDDTGWIDTQDDAALEGAFVDWLSGAVARVLDMLADGMVGFAIGMPAGHHFEHDGVVTTQLGPRGEAWLARTKEDGRQGIDIFPWWGERDARYYRDLALTQMWSEVRWRAPLTDDERGLLDQVATWIEKAHGLDSELELPWAEQSALLVLLEEESLRATRAHMRAQSRPGATIGYRRRPVRAVLSGDWMLTVPGEMAEKWEERGTWVAWDGTRSVWFTSLTVLDEKGAPSASSEATLASLPPFEAGEILQLERGDLRGYATFVEEERDGEILHRLEAHAALGEHAAVGTLVFVDAADREWALSTWGSLRRR